MAVENIKVCIRIRPLLQRDFVREDVEDGRSGPRAISLASRDEGKLRPNIGADKYSPTGNSVGVWRTGHNKIAVLANTRRLSLSFHSVNNENANSNYQVLKSLEERTSRSLHIPPAVVVIVCGCCETGNIFQRWLTSIWAGTQRQPYLQAQRNNGRRAVGLEGNQWNRPGLR